jgi:hypothetical protein
MGMYMHPSKFKESRILDEWIFQEASSMFNFNPDSYHKVIEPQIIAKNGILVSHSIVGMSFFSTIVDNSWFWG